MQAIILAAGMGKRLKELTKNNTKCMVQVNGVTLIERMLKQIDALNVSDVTIVVGYEGQKLIDFISTLSINTPIHFINNPVYDKTNNIYSLALAKDVLSCDDTLLFESDLIVEDGILEALVNDERSTLALVAKYEPWMDGTCVTLREDDSINSFISKNQFRYEDCDQYYKTVNIYKFSKDFSVKYYVPFLEAYQKALGENEYYEQVLRVITMLDDPIIRAKRLDGQKWYEIDDVQDLDIAESIFAEKEKRLSRLQQRYGGYWRYPRLLDFCYLVNPYFPPQRMKDELRSSFNELLTQYPSGMKVNALIAAKDFNIRPENIIVGNGAAELIKSLMEHLNGIIGFIRPTFEEYPNRYDPSLSDYYIPQNPDFSYTADDLIAYFSDRNIQSLVVVNPDNPSGSYIPYNDILRLIQWTKEKNIQLIVDESFADFSDETDNTLFHTELLNDNPHLYVVKSISKSYGVPGLRLGILGSGNRELISDMKKDVAIWNINSFGEYFLQIYEKYQKDYAKAMAAFRKERARFVSELSRIPGLRIIPSQANYVMIELLDVSPSDLSSRLLEHYDILIKDLGRKTNGNYIRIAVRDETDNNRLLAALDAELNHTAAS